MHLSNTCPLDNFLVIFWAALHNFSWLQGFFEINSNDDSFSGNICSTLQLVDEGKSAAAKVLWAEFLTIEPNAGLIIDLHGTEHSRFVAQHNNSLGFTAH